MKRATILMGFAPALALMGCGGSTGVGVRIDPLPASLTQPCPHPSALVSRGGTVLDDELSLGRMGDALILCGKQKAAIAAAFDSVREAVSE